MHTTGRGLLSQQEQLLGMRLRLNSYQVTSLFRFAPDDGLGEKKIWRVEDMELVEVRSWWKTVDLNMITRVLFSRLIVKSMDSSLVETPM